MVISINMENQLVLQLNVAYMANLSCSMSTVVTNFL